MIYAGFWKRLAAAWIDCLVKVAILIICDYIYGVFYWDDIATSALAKAVTDLDAIVEKANARNAIRQVHVFLISLAVVWIYYAVFESSRKQATLGKLAVEIKVTDLHGNRVGFFRASGRFFGKFVSATIFGIGYLMAAFTKRKQGLHDMMAGCLVIRRDAGPDTMSDPDSLQASSD